jgi:peptide/nickel transport system permease protein
VSEGRSYLRTAWWLSFFPGVALVVVTVSATVLSAWVRLAGDPAQRWRLTTRRTQRRPVPPAAMEIDREARS